MYLQRYGKVYGLYRGFHPTLTIADADLLKTILISDFHLFANRAKLNTYDSLWNENVFNAPDVHWKRIRTIVSPSFSSGKLRAMQRLMGDCVQKLVDYFEKTASGDGIFSPKEVMAGYTIDVIASTSFATETNANGTDSHGNSFVRNGLALFRMNPLKILSFLLMPRWVNDLFGVRIQFPDPPFRFFEKLAREIVKQRKEALNSKTQQSSSKNDFVQLLMNASVGEGELKDGDYSKLTANADNDVEITESLSEATSSKKPSSKQKLSDLEVIGQSVFFLIAGFETSSSVLHHIIFELALHEDVQERLSEDLQNSLKRFGGDTSSAEYFDTVMNGVPYLEAVVKEGLRKYPPLTRVERRCAVDGYKLGDTGITLEKDQHIEVPLWAVHHCEEYYPEPEAFKPERFLPENKHLLVQHAYMPFGMGPKNCLGTRFAYQEIKLCLAQVVSRFRFSATVDTPPVELSYKKSTLLLNSLPFTVRVSKRAF